MVLSVACPTAHFFFIPRFYDSTDTTRIELAMSLSDHAGSLRDNAYPLGTIFTHCRLPETIVLLALKGIKSRVIGDQPEMEGLLYSMKSVITPPRSFAYIADDLWCNRQADLSGRFAQEYKDFRVITYSHVPDSLR